MTDWLTVLIGDNRAMLPTLPAESVHCVVTSPPYWGLRDYGTATWDGGDAGCDHEAAKRPIGNSPSVKSTLTTNNGRGPQPGDKFSAGAQFGYAASCKCGAVRVDSQLGLEATPEQYVENMVDVFRKVRRVLRDDGTLWLNLGDSYASSGGEREYGSSDNGTGRGPGARRQDVPASGLKPKDLVGIPWRVAFALQADGWYLRSDIIWAKPNPMPESVTDRPTKSHEYLFLLTKSDRYYFDQEAVREPHTASTLARVEHGLTHRHPDNVGVGIPPVDTDRMGERFANPGGRNMRTVWTIPTQPYPGAHFATFPVGLVTPCMKAGTSERGVCPDCGSQWLRVIDRIAKAATQTGRTDGAVPGPSGMVDSTRTVGWRPSCRHYERASEWVEYPPRENLEDIDAYEERCRPVRELRTELLAHYSTLTTVPATMLDPFAGSGTVGFVANKYSRRAVLIDLNPDYLEQIEKRNLQVPMGL